MTTIEQDREFISSVVDTDLLENSIEWIKEKFRPDEVFSEADLGAWADENGYVAKDKLEEWALDNGYVVEP